MKLRWKISSLMAVMVVAPLMTISTAAFATPDVHSTLNQPTTAYRNVQTPDWASFGCLTGSWDYAAWALDNVTYTQTNNPDGTSTVFEHGTFTAYCDPTTGATLTSPVTGSFSGNMVWDWAGYPLSLNFTYIGPKHWVFTEYMPLAGTYTQNESFLLENAIP